MIRMQLSCAAAAAMLLAGSGCAALRPTVESVSARVVAIDFEGVELAVDVKVRNALPMAIKGPNGSYAIDVADAEFLKSDNIPPLDLPAADVGTVTLPARVEYRRLWRMYRNLTQADQVAFGVHGVLRCPVAGQTFELPFEHQGQLPVMRAPGLAVTDVRTSELSLRSAKLSVTAELRNPNVFPLDVGGLGYALRLGEIEVGAVTASTAGEIAPGTTGVLTLTGEIRATSALAKLVRGDSLGKPTLTATGTLKTPFGAVELPD